jgi:HPt (histidine-containing phosphotransfer) domain-containing protein
MQRGSMNARARPHHRPIPSGLEPFDGRPPSAELTRAGAMARFEDDAGFYARIVPLFRQAASEQSACLIAALERGDTLAVQHWAHTLKGSLLTVGANATASSAEEVELAARERRLDGLDARARRLAAEVAIIAGHLAPAGR